jgi:ABC-2 type transport system ATP-binding protein
MVTIELERLTRVFSELTAVDALSIAVEEGEIFGLVGPDGAGKTTTMRMLTAILPPSSGEARVLGRDVVTQAEAVKDEIGYMSQRFGLYPDLTVEENIRFYGDIYGVTGRLFRTRMDELLAFSNLTPFRKRFAGNLSGGMKQKLGLACALIHTPKVLFLDEPTNGVDPVSRRDFWRILYKLLQEGVTIFVSTAYLDEAERCTRVGLMHKGRLMALGTPAEVKSLMRGSLLEVTCGEARRAADVLRSSGFGSVTAFGDRLHIVVGETTEARARVRSALEAAGISCGDARVVEPTLEDVFVSSLSGDAP